MNRELELAGYEITLGVPHLPAGYEICPGVANYIRWWLRRKMKFSTYYRYVRPVIGWPYCRRLEKPNQ